MTPPVHNATAAACWSDVAIPPPEISRGEDIAEKLPPAPPDSVSWTAKFAVKSGRLLPFLFFPLLGLTGCSDGGATTPSSPDAEPDCDPSGVSVRDRDGDGFDSSLDCDDCRADVFPLRAGETREISADATICPGTYRNARVLIANRDGLKVEGSGVVLEHPDSLAPEEGVLELRFANNITITGLSFETAATAIRLGASSGNLLEDMQIRLSDCATGISLFAAAGNTLRRVTFSGPGAPLLVEPGVQSAAGGRNLIEEFQGRREGASCPEFAVALRSAANEVKKGRFTDLPLVLEESGGNTVETSSISGNLNNGYETGLIVFSSGNTVRGNRITANKVGIFLGRFAADNGIVANDLRGNADACIDVHPAAEDNLVSENFCDRP